MKVAFPTVPTAPVTQKFDNYNPALYGGDRKHKGLDYGVVPNSPIYACMSGVVSYAATQQTGYGRHVRIVHDDGSMSIYGHLNALLVSQGDTVQAGQLIGKSGGDPKDGVDGDGLSTGAHLHWEIRPPNKHATDQTAVDPELYCLQYVPETVRLAEVTAYNGLNVRAAPSATAPKTRYDALRRREIVGVVETTTGWARLRSLRPEWVSTDWIQYTGETVEVGGETEKPAELSDKGKLDRLWEVHPELWG